jgi:hypothetical protein
MHDGTHLLSIATETGHYDLVQCLIKELGADVLQTDIGGAKPFFIAAYFGFLRIVSYFLVEGSANVTEVDNNGCTVWKWLKLDDADDAELSSLLHVMVLLGDAPPEFVAKLSPQHAKLCARGRQLRMQLPAFLEQQRTSVMTYCPLPGDLLPLVATYAAPTPEDMWTDGLHIWVSDCFRPGCNGAGLLRCVACQQVRYCGQPCQRFHWKMHKAECKRLQGT